SGMRWRVWMIVASGVRSVVLTPATSAKKRRIDTALGVSSAPWSITLSTSSGPMIAAVAWIPPVAQPEGHGSSRLPDGAWEPGPRHGLEDGPPDRALGLLVQVGEVVAARGGHGAALAQNSPSPRGRG